MRRPSLDLSVQMIILVDAEFLGIVDRTCRACLVAVGTVDVGVDGGEDIICVFWFGGGGGFDQVGFGKERFDGCRHFCVVRGHEWGDPPNLI